MSALTDLFTAMANKIRSKTGTATTYTPSEMASDGIDDVYDAGVASVPTPTSITPSNASPVTLTANTAVKPTANGYAIKSYNSVTPSDVYPVALTSGEIDKMGGNGYAIESYSDVTPSDASPVDLTRGIYKMSGAGKAVASITTLSPSNSNPQVLRGKTPYIENNGSALHVVGYAIEDYSSVTPSNSSPVTLSSGSIYKMSGAGKAVASVTSKTPSDSSPASVTANSIIQPSAAGYLVESIRDFGAPTYVKQGNMSASGGSLSQTTSSRAKLVIAYRARYGNNNGNSILFVWDAVKEVGYIAQYSDSYTNNAMSSTQTHISVTDSSVTFTNSSSYTQRGSMMIWC